MSGDEQEHSLRARAIARVEEAFRTLPERYLGAEPGFDATYQIRLADIGRTWEVRLTESAAIVHLGRTRRAADVTIATDSKTWMRLRRGELSGIEAFSKRLLAARGSLDLAIGFEGRFRLEGDRPPLLRIHRVQTGREQFSTLTMGSGPDMLLIHGLGAAKSSFLHIAAELSHSYRIHAIDLPGFGNSSKPLRAAYDARWFARMVLAWLDAMELERAHIVGNSMGGRVAIELGLTHPERVGGLALLTPAVAFARRPLLPLVRIARPELGVLPHGFTRGTVASQFWNLFADRDAIDPRIADVVVDEFRHTYASPAARRAFLSAARNIYLERPFGHGGFYERLAGLEPPALFIWGTHDRLIPAASSHLVAEALPAAEQITLRGCGHVPQVERPEQTSGLLQRFFTRVDALGTGATSQAA